MEGIVYFILALGMAGFAVWYVGQSNKDEE
jgi:hypothetical protein